MYFEAGQAMLNCGTGFVKPMTDNYLQLGKKLYRFGLRDSALLGRRFICSFKTSIFVLPMPRKVGSFFPIARDRRQISCHIWVHRIAS
jgi:hypothetical protein